MSNTTDTSNTVRVEFDGVAGRVFMPDGTELKKILDVQVLREKGQLPRLVVEFSDFIVSGRLP